MKVDYLYLTRALKTVLIVLLLSVAGTTKGNAEETDPYLLYMLFNDYQVCEQLVPQREWNGIDDIRCMQLPRDESGMQASWYYLNTAARTTGFLAMAQNEKEGFQVFFREQEKERNLRIEVSPFLNSQNEVLQHSLYWEDFFYADGIFADSLAEALIPYTGKIQKTTVGHNKVFYVELKSVFNQTPGEYKSTITVFDGDEVLSTRSVTVKVWNFTLPENHYSEVVMGLYNCNSGYGATKSIFTLNGIDTDAQGNVAEKDMNKAKEILDSYQECLLNHGVSTIEIPRWKINDDPKAAELTMADPRRKVFSIPAHRGHFYNGDFNSNAKTTINQYKSIVYDNPFLKDKAFFYPMDEPKGSDEEAELLTNITDKLKDLWPGYHAVVPFYGDYNKMTTLFDGKIDILCPNQSSFDPYGSNYDVKQSYFLDFIDRSSHPNRFRTWRYQGDSKCGGTYFWIFPLSSIGVMRRVPFWQQYAMNSDGWLQWNCAYLPDNWEKKSMPSASGIQTGNGDGILLYPGTLFGQSADTPIVSLRLKQLSEGIDDYDYLHLGKEFLDESELNKAIGVFYWYDYTTNCKLLNKEFEYYASYTCQNLQRARYEIGQRLSVANTEHNWGEWQTAVYPDKTHNGLEICSCMDCGAQRSRIKIWEPCEVGDVNGNGVVDISDVTSLVNIILGKLRDTTGMADVNDDGNVDISDVSILVNMIIGKTQ